MSMVVEFDVFAADNLGWRFVMAVFISCNDHPGNPEEKDLRSSD